MVGGGPGPGRGGEDVAVVFFHRLHPGREIGGLVVERSRGDAQLCGGEEGSQFRHDHLAGVGLPVGDGLQLAVQAAATSRPVGEFVQGGGRVGSRAGERLKRGQVDEILGRAVIDAAVAAADVRPGIPDERVGVLDPPGGVEHCVPAGPRSIGDA